MESMKHEHRIALCKSLMPLICHCDATEPHLQEWSVIGRLPFRIKTTLVGYWDGWLYFTSGQRDKGPKDPSPKKVVGCMFRTKLHLRFP